MITHSRSRLKQCRSFSSTCADKWPRGWITWQYRSLCSETWQQETACTFATYSLTSPYKFENDLLSIPHADRIDGGGAIKVADLGLAEDIYSSDKDKSWDSVRPHKVNCFWSVCGSIFFEAA